MISILITKGESHRKYEPPPEMGINRKIVPMDEVTKPKKSTFFAPSLNVVVGSLEGRNQNASKAFKTPNGANIQNNPLHVDRSTKAAARNGPVTLPNPIILPIIPWYLPRSSSVTTSDVIIMARFVIPPVPIPATPRKT